MLRNSLFTNPVNNNAVPADQMKLLDIIDEFRNSDLEIELVQPGYVESISLKKLIDRETGKGKDIIFTFTPGPFVDGNELPQKWMETPQAVGCTKQLQSFEAHAHELNALIININKHPSAYQQELLERKNLAHVYMISDANNALQTTFNLPTLQLPDERYSNSDYFKRFTFTFRKNGLRNVYVPQSPVDDNAAVEHVEKVKEFNEMMVDCPGMMRR